MYRPFANADSTFRLLEPVQRAPSIFNTQPWWFRILADDRIELCARIGEGGAYQHLEKYGLELGNGDRWLPGVDPEARELIVSCGAALFNLRLSIRVAGHDLAISMLPYAPDRSVLASVEIVTSRVHAPTSSEQELYDAIPRRHSDRWPYGGADRRLRKGDPVLPNILATMVLAAAGHKGSLRVLGRPEVKRWLREAEQADSKLRSTRGYATELSRWTNYGGSDIGVPANAFGPTWEDHGRRRNHHPPVRDFRANAAVDREGTGRDEDSGEDESPGEPKVKRFERLPQLMLLSTRHNQPLDWLRAGQALQHALLVATRYGVSASFLTQPFELRDHDIQRRLWESEKPRERMSRSRDTMPDGSGQTRSAPTQDDLRLRSRAAQRDPALRQSWPWSYPEYPQMIIRVGYATHDAFVTRREDPDVLDCRCDPPSWVRSATPIDL